MKEQCYTILGIMSGTSLDGIDFALCTFTKNHDKWEYDILDAKTYPYDKPMRSKLDHASSLKGRDLIDLDRKFGDYLGLLANTFIGNKKPKPMLIASHGHTVFHEPHNGITLQIGCGANIMAKTGIVVVSDFRTVDVAKGGEGAPLVPVGDKLLFSEYEACLNLGGFANISFDQKGERKAGDICPVNIILNSLARAAGNDFDKDGRIGRRGKIQTPLLEQLNNLQFYKQKIPKSLGKEWLQSYFLPVLDPYLCSLEDKASTVYHHIRDQIAEIINSHHLKQVLVTGGGAYNKFLIELITQATPAAIVIPSEKIIDFKEAIVFAFLGLLRFRSEINCLASVTGAQSDSICGVVYINKESG